MACLDPVFGGGTKEIIAEILSLVKHGWIWYNGGDSRTSTFEEKRQVHKKGDSR